MVGTGARTWGTIAAGVATLALALPAGAQADVSVCTEGRPCTTTATPGLDPVIDVATGATVALCRSLNPSARRAAALCGGAAGSGTPSATLLELGGVAVSADAGRFPALTIRLGRTLITVGHF
ncbi:hypothetical protein [Conexibacter sp. SYSU D00693]|uniref:hypothetical protein n=1 Tax=Conexibacter sp. SYSU D00693 TaxID=2812560 RepID=UPI00196AFB07|nr:hypothetical protein [Conexibacter sp. SYSU D00693]